MTLKRWVLWLCIVALLAGEFFLFSANRQKDAAQVSLREARQEAAQLEAQLNQLKADSASAQGADTSRLRLDNQSLAQKLSLVQKEADQLRAANQQLAQQLAATREVLDQQQVQLQQWAADNPQVFLTPAEAERNACIINLSQIDAAKNQWALENSKTTGAVPPAQELLSYFKDEIFPVCPGGGNYTIGAVGEVPTCSIRGHALPQ